MEFRGSWRIEWRAKCTRYSRVEDVGGVVHTLLEGSVCVGEGLCGGAEAHVLAEVVAALCAVRAVVAHDAGLDRDTLARDEVLDTGADGGDDACGLVAEDEWCLDDEVSVTSVCVVVHCGGGGGTVTTEVAVG